MEGFLPAFQVNGRPGKNRLMKMESCEKKTHENEKAETAFLLKIYDGE